MTKSLLFQNHLSNGLSTQQCPVSTYYGKKPLAIVSLWGTLALTQGGTLWGNFTTWANQIPTADCRNLLLMYCDAHITRGGRYRYDILDAFTQHLLTRNYGQEEGLATISMHHALINIDIFMGPEKGREFAELQSFRNKIDTIARQQSTNSKMEELRQL
jgi:hypothetical protein